MGIRPATANEVPYINDLALRSKSSWGYSEEFMEVFKDEMAIDASDCERGSVRIIEESSIILGFYKLSGIPPIAELDCLFVEPEHKGQGIGTELFNRARSHAAQLGFTALEIVADPNALGFYDRMGAKLVDYGRSLSIPDRWLPVLRAEI